MAYRGSCHCGRVAFEVEGEINRLMECNCSHCSRKGFLLWFGPRDALRITTPSPGLTSYQFNKHVITHQFCPTCGCAPFAFGTDPSGNEVAAINARCLEDFDRSGVEIVQVDGRSL